VDETAFRGADRSARVTLAALAVLLGCGEEAPPLELPPRAIQWERVSGTVTGEERVLSGIVTAVSDTRLAFEVGGTVVAVPVALGEAVERGQELARLDREPFELAVRDAEATLTEATAQQTLARTEFERTRSLYRSGVSSRQKLDTALALRDARDSQVDAAQARLDLARRDLRRSVLEAPFAGKISVRAIEPAMKVTSAQTVFEMDSGESGLRVEVQMPETLIARIRLGAEVRVGFPSEGGANDGRSFPAVVSEVGARAGVGNAFPVRADLVEAPPGLRPGMTAEVGFGIARDASGLSGLEGFLIPIGAALAEADDRFSVFVYDPGSSTVVKTPIQTGGVRDNDIAVLEGLAEGDVIATAGVSFLRDGQPVTLLGDELSPGTR
jgi:RND family efflux transporter MFP subunit